MVTRSHIDTVRAYWAASDDEDWEAAGRCIGSGFTWIDHTFGDEPMDDALAVAEVQAWTDSKRVIDEWFEATDGTVIVLATITRTLRGAWRGVEPSGQRVTSKVCDIFRFNEEGLIVHDEMFQDELVRMRLLGAM
jgi:hypothetical protein